MKHAPTIDRALALQLADAAAARDSGIVTAVRDRARRLFCIADGRICYATSNVIEEQLHEVLLRRELLQAGDVTALRIEADRQKRKVAELVVEQGLLDREALEQVVTEHVRQLLFDTLSWSGGTCEFTRGRPDLEGEITVALPSAPLLVEYARHHPATANATRVRVGPPTARPIFCGEREHLLDALEADPATEWVLANADGSNTLHDLAAAAPGGAEAGWHALYGLILAGLVELDSQRRERDVASVGAVTRAEIDARLEKAKDADHYMILELNPTAEFDEIREAYYFLARRYHPDRFRAGKMQDLLQPMERYFTQVTEAYNTLIDSESRAEFDELREAAATPGRESEQDTRYLAKQNAIAARAFIDKGRFTDAAKYLENAIQLNGTEATYHLELGQLLLGNPRRRADAEEHLLEANRLDPALADGYLGLGQLYLKMQRGPQAAKMFREVLRWEPGHIEATRLLKALADGDDATDDGGLLRGLFRELASAEPMAYLVDGDNLLGTWPDRRRTDAERHALSGELARLARRERHRCVVVFDGYAETTSRADVDVVFAGRSRSADDVILERLRNETDPAGWTVVTADRSLGDRCRHLGASVVRSDRFRRRLRELGD